MVALIVGVGRPAGASEPVVLTDQHADIRFVYAAGADSPLRLVVLDDDASPPRVLDSTNVLFSVSEGAKVGLPGDLPPLGLAGDPIWVITASQQAGVPYLGISAEGVPGGVFARGLDLRLLGVEGPGQVFVWQAEAGGLTFWMNSRDGFGEEDRFTQLVGGHSHLNWGFTTSGVYRLRVQASGRRLGEETNLLSEPAVFTFHVQPVPVVEPGPFELWRRARWPGVSDVATTAPGADPDGDGRVNLLEYWEGTDPTRADGSPGDALAAVVEWDGPVLRPGVRPRRSSHATDVRAGLVASEGPGGPWGEVAIAVGESRTLADGRIEQVFREAGVGNLPGHRWYRLVLTLSASSKP